MFKTQIAKIWSSVYPEERRGKVDASAGLSLFASVYHGLLILTLLGIFTITRRSRHCRRHAPCSLTPAEFTFGAVNSLQHAKSLPPLAPASLFSA